MFFSELYPVVTPNISDQQRTIMFGVVSSHADAMGVD